MIQLINRDSPIPLYYQLKTILLDKIKLGEWMPGELIPSENQLQESYDISRTTVRQTLSELVTEGYLVRQRGRGTFVSQPKVTYNPTKQLELNDFMRHHDETLSWRMLDREWIDVPARVMGHLNLSEDDQVLRIRRLRLASGDPLGYHVAYISRAVAEYLDEDKLTVGQSLNYILTHPQMRAPRIVRTLEADMANDLDQDWLLMAPNTPILQLERIVYGENNTPLEFLDARFRGDRFKYQVTQ